MDFHPLQEKSQSLLASKQALNKEKQVDKLDLENLPFDPAIEAGKEAMAEMKKSSRYEEDDPNRPETEEDGIRAETIRRFLVRRLCRGVGPIQS